MLRERRDAVTKVHMGIEQGAKAMDEGHSADPGGWALPRAALAQALLHRTEENMQRQGLYGRVVLQVVAQAWAPRASHYWRTGSRGMT